MQAATTRGFGPVSLFFSWIPKNLRPSNTWVLGDDLAGIIVEKGSMVKQFEVGDEVYGMSMNFRTGSCAEFAAISHDCIAQKPVNLRYAEAASVPLAGLTALQALSLGNVNEYSNILIIGASGGVGTFAVQIAKAMGAYVTGVCSGKNSDLVLSLGADEVIDYTKRSFIDEEHDFDVVIDATSFESLFSCSSILKEDGIYVTTAGFAHSILTFFAAKYRPGKQRSKKTWVNSNTKDLEKLRYYLESGQVVPVLDSEYSLSEISKSYARSKTGRAVGKIVINIK